ncbi:MAG: carboxypeptidase-like regulatory domain-containing protein [Bacteroidales bacterium]
MKSYFSFWVFVFLFAVEASAALVPAWGMAVGEQTQEVRPAVQAPQTLQTRQIVQGIVYDGASRPFPFVSVYLKSNPYIGTSSGEDGTFLLHLEKGQTTAADVLVFSFIGYKTVEQPIESLNPDHKLVIKLIEQPILLEGAAVTAKVSRKTSKAAKLSFIEKFRKQLEVDFPKINRNYYVVSEADVRKGKELLISNEMIGNIYEYPQGGKRGGDSIRIVQESIKNFTNQQIKEGIERYLEKARADSLAAALGNATRKAKKQVDKSISSSVRAMTKSAEMDKRSIQLHKLLWWSDIRAMLKNMDFKNLNNWEITYPDHNTMLTYREKKGFLGIVKMVRTVHFILDSYTYGVERLSENIIAELNIPFGYKLRPEQLELLNIVNIGGNDIDKFRLRHVNMDMKRNVFYQPAENGKLADEKNLDAGFSIENNKKEKLDYNARARAKVMWVR